MPIYRMINWKLLIVPGLPLPPSHNKDDIYLISAFQALWSVAEKGTQQAPSITQHVSPKSGPIPNWRGMTFPRDAIISSQCPSR